MSNPATARSRQLRIGRFIVRRALGSGLQGKVFEAFDPHLERPVAIKWLNPADGNAPPASSRIWPSEARIVARLQHPNVVPLYEAGVHRGIPYLVFAYVDGTTLRSKRAQGGAMPVQEALALFRAMLDGVACAHAQGVLHLDLTPGNIMIDRAGVPHIMDFGLARITGGDTARLEDGSVIGTPRYMSPEHFNGSPLTARADVFALGLILYEMLTGESPVPSDDLATLVNAIADRQLELEEMGRLRLDAGLQALVRRALSHDPECRFADAGEMKLALEAWLGSDRPAEVHSTVEFLLNRMQRKANFPALSNNLIEINRLTEPNSHSSVAALANVVLRDFAITNRLLKLANSSFYGRAGLGVKTVSDAIHLLGLNAVRIACNGLVYLGAMKGGDRNLSDALIASFVSALVGRHMAVLLGRRDLAEEAFICGMFHRLGRTLAIFYFQEEFQEIERLAGEQGLSEETAAARVLGIGYGDLGAAVAGRWKFPEIIRESMPCPPPGCLPPPATAVEMQQQIAAFANELCDLAVRAPADQRPARMSEFCARFAGLVAITPAALVELLQSALGKLTEFAPVLGLELAGSGFVSGAGDFLAAMRAPAASPHGADEPIQSSG